MLKNVAFDSLATALANIVLPLPGGPNNNKPRAGARNPVKSYNKNIRNQLQHTEWLLWTQKHRHTEEMNIQK